MRIPLPSAHPINLREFMLRNGYASRYNPLTNRLSFARRLGSSDYPRLHIYIEKDVSGQTYFNLHLDQKPPSYPGVHAHNAEYNGPVVEGEGRRLYQLLQSAVAPKPKPSSPRTSWWPWHRGE